MNETDAALINQSGQNLSTAANIMATGSINRATQRWNEQMYGRQRADALSDWQMQNLYNSPAEQMKRLKEAGLNANLVYGNGVKTEAGPVRSTEAKAWNPQVPDFSGIGRGVSSAIQTYQDVALQQEQVKIMKQQQQNMAMDNTIKSAQLAGMLQDNTRKALDYRRSDLGYQRDLETYDTSVALLQENLRKMRTGIDLSIQGNERANLQSSQSIQESIARVGAIAQSNLTQVAQRGEIAQRVQSLQKDVQLKDLDIALKSKGIMPGDPWYFRVLGQVVETGDVKAALQFVKTKLTELLQSPPTEKKKTGIFDYLDHLYGN